MFFCRYTTQIMVKKIFAPLQLSSIKNVFLVRKNIGGAFTKLRQCLCSAAAQLEGHAVVVGVELRFAFRMLCVGFVVHNLASGQVFSSTFYSVTIIRPNSLMLLSSRGWTLVPIETAVPQTVSHHHKRMKRKCNYYIQSTVVNEQVYGLSLQSSAKSNLGNME